MDPNKSVSFVHNTTQNTTIKNYEKITISKALASEKRPVTAFKLEEADTTLEEQLCPEINPESLLRHLSGDNSIVIFDIDYILSLLNKKYGFNHKLTDFSVPQRME